MKMRPLGSTGLNVAPIGLGAAQLGSSEYDHAKDVVFKSLDLGVNYFDTARGYWDSEIKLGKALKGERENVIVSSKTTGKTKEEAATHIDESLQRLQTDYIDNYHLHALSDLDDVDIRLGGPLEALLEAREAGKIRHIGVTGHTFPSILIAALKRFKFDTFLVPLNIVEREPLAELIPLALETKLGVTIMKPVATGLLPAPLALKWLMNQEEAEVAKWSLDLATDRCRICMECLPCPSDIEIPGTLGTDVMYNHYRSMGPAKFAEFPWEQSRVDDEWKNREATISKIDDHAACDSCMQCESRCPYGLPIVSMLRSMSPNMKDMLDIWSKQGSKV